MNGAERMSVLDLLGQGEIWINGGGETLRISEMELRHIRNVRAYLLRSGRVLAEQAYHRIAFGPQPSGDMASDAFDAILEELTDATLNPEPWLEKSELIQAFDARLAVAEKPQKKSGYVRDTRLDGMLVEFAKEKAPEDRGLLDTLLALDVPMDRALDLVVGETSRAANGSLAQMAWLIRESRMTQFPEGSEVRRRLGMIADMLDPKGKDSWEF